MGHTPVPWMVLRGPGREAAAVLANAGSSDPRQRLPRGGRKTTLCRWDELGPSIWTGSFILEIRGYSLMR